jgi:N-acetylglucosamine malate deacetylase 2
MKGMQSLNQGREKVPRKIEVFLTELRSGAVLPNDREVAIVVAHQDDESIAYGSLIPRMPHCLMIHVTDGAPIDRSEWKGAVTREEYAHTRERELNIALDRAGHTGERVSFGETDQQAGFHLAENARKLATLFQEKGIQYVMTHAYEGGHPDHDAVTFSVHAAKKIMAKLGLTAEIIEAPLYRRVGDVSVFQNFVPNERETIELRLTKKEMRDKSMLYDAYRSQESVFDQRSASRGVSTEVEQLREAPDYDFSVLPNNGNMSPLFNAAGIKDQWQTLINQALDELSIR